MSKSHFSVTVDREDGPAVVVTVRRPTEDEAVAYWQHRDDAEDPKRAAHGGHADSAAEILIGCVTSVALAPLPPGAAPPATPDGPDAALLGGGSPQDQFRALREEYPHLPRQLGGRFQELCGSGVLLADAPASAIPEAVRQRCAGQRLRAVLVDPKPQKGPDGKTVKGPDGKVALDGKLVVMTRLTSSEVEFMDAEAATDSRNRPSAAQMVAQAKAHVVEAPAGLLAEHPLLALYLGQLLYSSAAAKLSDRVGE